MSGTCNNQFTVGYVFLWGYSCPWTLHAALQRSLNVVELANERELLQSCTLASRNANVHQLKPEIDEQCRDWAYRLVDLNSASCAMSWDDKLRTKEDYLLWQEVSPHPPLLQHVLG